MLKSLPYLNEIVSLTVMLLMIIALVAGQANAKSHEQARSKAAVVETGLTDSVDLPFHTTIKAHVSGHPFTISIDADARFRLIGFDDD